MAGVKKDLDLISLLVDFFSRTRKKSFKYFSIELSLKDMIKPLTTVTKT